jgi:hypothetical protein
LKSLAGFHKLVRLEFFGIDEAAGANTYRFEWGKDRLGSLGTRISKITFVACLKDQGLLSKSLVFIAHLWAPQAVFQQPASVAWPHRGLVNGRAI